MTVIFDFIVVFFVKRGCRLPDGIVADQNNPVISGVNQSISRRVGALDLIGLGPERVPVEDDFQISDLIEVIVLISNQSAKANLAVGFHGPEPGLLEFSHTCLFFI